MTTKDREILADMIFQEFEYLRFMAYMDRSQEPILISFACDVIEEPCFSIGWRTPPERFVLGVNVECTVLYRNLNIRLKGQFVTYDQATKSILEFLDKL